MLCWPEPRTTPVCDRTSGLRIIRNTSEPTEPKNVETEPTESNAEEISEDLNASLPKNDPPTPYGTGVRLRMAIRSMPIRMDFDSTRTWVFSKTLRNAG